MILQRLSTSRLHCHEAFDGPVAVGGPPPRGLEELRDIVDGHIVHMRSAEVDGRVIADADLHAVLHDAGVSGLRAAGSPKDLPDDLPLAGNLVDPSWLAIALGGQCPSRCSFCFTEFIRREPGLDASMVERILQRAAQIGTIDTVVFTGGEPTIRPDLAALIARATELGFTRVELQTNGHRLADAALVEQLTQVGLTGVLLSLHGATARTHDAIVGVRGSFELALKALRNAVCQGLHATVNHVVCQQNLEESAALVDTVDAVSCSVAIRYSYPIVEGAAWTNAGTLLTSLPDFVDAVVAARAARRGNGLIETANVPPCISKRTGTSPSYLLSQRRTVLLASPFYRGMHHRGELLAKLDACAGCADAPDCDGLQVPYLMQFRDAHQHVAEMRR